MSITGNKNKIGQTLVEFSLVLPTLMVVILGMVEFGRILQVWITVQNCAQAAARYATTGQQSVDPSIDKWDSTRLAAIKAEAVRKAVTLKINTSVGPSSPGYFHVYVYASDPPVLGNEYPGGPNARVAVDVVFNNPLMTPLINLFFPYITLHAHTEMINEQFRHPGYGTPVGLLPPTIYPTPIPTNTPTNTATATIPPTSTSTLTAQPTSTTAPTSTSTKIPTTTSSHR
jgi:Flp pilus assembly protein TadG